MDKRIIGLKLLKLKKESALRPRLEKKLHRFEKEPSVTSRGGESG